LNNINALTVCRYFKIAEQCQCKELRQKIIVYVRDNYREIRDNEKFRTFVNNNPILAMDLIFFSTGFK
jgi:hypothetical protein